jgi:2,4-dienoyl-CoA reductase-like NADH-dependent reductase (Old Yellow Enzyme family)
MSILFEPATLAGMTLKNRFVRSATWEGLAHEDSSCSTRLVNVIRNLAKGEVGLIISSHAYVAREGQASPWQLSVDDDRFVPGLRRMADAAHEHGSKILLQLAHAGIQAAESLTGQDALGPSPVANKHGVRGREMTIGQISQTVRAFGRAAERANEAGFDGVQIHAAHGYLLSQFLSPHFNKRTDEYGGSTRNRAQIVLQVIEEVTYRLGDTFPVLIKINSDDFLEDGMKVDEMLRVAKLLEWGAVDGVELSGGTPDPASTFSPIRKASPASEDDEVYYRDAARRYKERLRVPLILVGGIRSYEVAEQLVEQGVADFISLSRPLIREPDLIARWKSGETRKSECESCVQCLQHIHQGGGIRCVA